MANNVLQMLMAGFDRLEGHVLDGNGIINGVSATTQVSSGAAGSAGFRILGVKTSDITIPEPDVVPDTGDDSYLGGFIFPSANIRAFTIEAAVSNMTNDALFQNTKPYNIGNGSVAPYDVPTPTLPTIALIAVSNAKSQAAGSVGVGMFGGVIVPSCQIFPLGRTTFSERQAGVFRARVVMTQAAAFPWGETFTTTNVGTTGATILEWSDTYRKTMWRGTGDGATTTFGPLPYIPASTSLNDVVVVTVNATSGIASYVTANCTINQATRQITFSVAPALNTKIVVYESYVLSN